MVLLEQRNHPHSVTLRVPPLPLPGGEEMRCRSAGAYPAWFPLPRAGGEVARRDGVGVLPQALPLSQSADTMLGVHHG